MFSDLDLIEPHPLWQLEQGSSFHQDLTLSKKTVCERFFWERLYLIWQSPLASEE
jgi:hypothetical protein